MGQQLFSLYILTSIAANEQNLLETFCVGTLSQCRAFQVANNITATSQILNF
jgi:hypothetical protein